MKTPIEKLLSLYDNISSAARDLGLPRQQLQLWKRQGYIPYKRGKFIEDATKSKITASEIWQEAGKLGR